MISDVVFTVIVVASIATLVFDIISIRQGNGQLIHKLYFGVSIALVLWMTALASLKFIATDDFMAQRIVDAIMYTGGLVAPVFSLLIALTFVRGLTRMPRQYWLFFLIPVLSVIANITNPLHHLFYRTFSLNQSVVEFGPFFYISGVYEYFCLGLSVILMVAFAAKTRNKLFVKQALMFSLGSAVPLVVSCMATFKLAPLSVASTPIAFTFTILFHGIAIFYFHMLDLKPIAQQRVLEWISDGYLVMGEAGQVVVCNEPFRKTFGRAFQIEENTQLKDRLKDEDIENKTGLYNLITAIDSCKATSSAISYEQALLPEEDGGGAKRYFMVEISPLTLEKRIVGAGAFFKDVTRVKENMQKLADSQARMMENERLASLGQMVGGIAHNLKTPIMGISGSVTAVENLVSECEVSLGDPEVTKDDYCEILGEMRDWISKIRESCAYMSDIITAVKGQATNANATDEGEFTLSEMLKRVQLLLRHELIGSNCRIVIKNAIQMQTAVHGDVNNLVQVVNNLVSNAMDAMRPSGGGAITIQISRDTKNLNLRVRDTGTGVSEEVRERLFRQMITSKGTQGTGLGIFISNSVIRAKFGGKMWLEDNPEGGSVFGIAIPLDYVTFREKSEQGGEQE